MSGESPRTRQKATPEKKRGTRIKHLMFEKIKDPFLHRKTKLERLNKALKQTPPRPYRRYNPRNPPIKDMKNVPADWSHCDSDIAEWDVEATIQRCKDRIADGIMPQWWERKLERYQKIQRDREATFNAEGLKGLTKQTAQRVLDLKKMRPDIAKAGDPYDQLQNLDAIISAYQLKQTNFLVGKVSYWSNGKFLKEKPKFEFEDLCEALKAHGEVPDHANVTGFWLEGLFPAGGMPRYEHVGIAMENPLDYLHYVDLTIAALWNRNGEQGELKRKFLDDTGACFMDIYEEDIIDIKNASGRPILFVGYMNFFNARGQSSDPLCLIQACLKSPHTGNFMSPWCLVPCSVMRGAYTPGTGDRLNGMWMRNILYTATCPDDRGILYLSDNIQEIVDNLPDADQSKAKRGQEGPNYRGGSLIPPWLQNHVVDCPWDGNPVPPGGQQLMGPGGIPAQPF